MRKAKPRLVQDWIETTLSDLDWRRLMPWLRLLNVRYVVARQGLPTNPGFTLAHDYDLSKVLTSSEGITSALPDQHGLEWVVTKTDGVVLTVKDELGIPIKFVGTGEKAGDFGVFRAEEFAGALFGES